MAEEPPYLAVGTEVSAKYKGAFCEAKIRKVVRSVKCKVTFKLPGIGSITVPDDQVKGQIRNGATVEVKHPDRKDILEATITKVQDCSQYTVVFDDGDITTLRRTALCLKSGRHFAESETLDQLPLTHPEHFSNPVIGGRRGRRRGGIGEASEDEEAFLNLKDYVDIKEEDIGRVVCVEGAEKKKQKDNWFPALVVAPTAQDQSPIDIRLEYLVRSFKDGRYYTVPKKEAQQFTREIGSKVETTVLKTAVEKALLFLDKDELPPHWDRDSLFGQNEFPGTDSEAGLDYESSDDEPREEKDHFVAQLYKFMDDSGTPINKGPIICNQDVDLYKLFKVVQNLGGFNRVSNHNNWKLVSNKMGFGQNPATVNLVKQSYKKFLYSFEEFYRKLGCTMVNHPRTSRTRTRSTRSLIRDRDKAVKVEPKPETKEKKRRSSTASITIKVEPPESLQEHKTTSPTTSKEKSLTKLVAEKSTEEIEIKEEPPDLDVIDVLDQHQTTDIGDSSSKPEPNLFAKSESHFELNGVYTMNPGYFVPAVETVNSNSPSPKSEIMEIDNDAVASTSAVKDNEKQVGVTKARKIANPLSGIYASTRKLRSHSNKKPDTKNMSAKAIKVKEEPLDVSYDKFDMKKLMEWKPRKLGRSESVKEIKSVPHRSLDGLMVPVEEISKKFIENCHTTKKRNTKQRAKPYVRRSDRKTEMATSSSGTHEIVKKRRNYRTTGTTKAFPMPIKIKVEPPDGYEQWYGGPSGSTKEKTDAKKVPDVKPVEEVKIKEEPHDETDVTVEQKEIKKTRQRKTSDSIVGKSELNVLPTRNRRIFTDTVTTRPKKDKPKPLAVKREKSPVAPRLKRQTINKDQFKMKTTKASNSLGNHDSPEKASKGKGKEDPASSRVKKDETGHAVSSDEKRKGRKRRERNEFFDMGFEPLPCYKTINVGDKLKVYYGPKHDLKVTYEAKVLSIRQEGSDTMYLVHYYGWNTRYDEWIKHSRIADNMSSGRITKKSLQASHINGRRRTTQTRTPVRVDPDIIVIPDDPKLDNSQVTPPATIKPKGTRSSTRTANKRLMSISENEDNEADHLPHETSSRKKLILDTHEIAESTPSERRGRKRKSVESEEKEKSEDEHDLSKSRQKKRSVKKLDVQSKESTQETATPETSQTNAPKEPKLEVRDKKIITESKQEPSQEKASVVNKDEEINTIPIKVEPPSPTMPDESPINFEGFDQSSDEEFSLYLDEEALDSCGNENKKESSKENSRETKSEKVEAPLPKGCDYDLNEIRSQLKGIDTTVSPSPEIKVEPEEETEEINVEDVQDVVSEGEEEEDEEDVEEGAKDTDENTEQSQSQSNSEISAPIKQEVEDIYEFKEPEPFEFESRKIDEKNKLQRRSLNRYIEENKLSPQRKKDVTLSPTYISSRFTLPEDNLITVQKEKDLPVSEYSTFQTCEEAFDKICASPLRAANEAVPLFEEQVVNDHIEDNLDDDSQDRLVISERYSDNDNDTNETEQKEEMYAEETTTDKDLSPDNIPKTVSESDKNKDEIRDEWKDEVEDEELNVAIQRVINRDSSDESNDSVILTNQPSIRGETTKIENNFDLSGKPNFNYQFGFTIKHPIDPEPKEQEVITRSHCEKSNEVETEEVDTSLTDENSDTLQKIESHREENKDEEPLDKEVVCEVTTDEVKSDDDETQNEITEENIIIDSEEIDVTGEIVDNSEIDDENTEVLVTEPIEATELVETEVEETEIDESTQIVEATVETIEVEETEEIAEATEIAELVTVTEEVAGTEEIVDTEEVEVMNDVDEEEEEEEDDMEEVENEQVYGISYSEEKPAGGVGAEIDKIENIENSPVKVEEDEYEVVEGIDRDEEDEDVVVEVKDVLLKEDDIEDKDEDPEVKVGVIDDKDEEEDEEDEEEENLISLLCDEEIIPNSPNHQPVEIQEEEIKTSLAEAKSFDCQDADNDEEIPLIEKIKDTSKDKENAAETSSLPGSPNSTKASRKKEKQPSASVSRNSTKKDNNSKKKSSSDDSKKAVEIIITAESEDKTIIIGCRNDSSVEEEQRSETRLKKSEGKTCTKKGRRPRKKSQDTIGKRKYSRSTRHHGSDSDDTYENPRAGSSKDSCHRPSRNSKYNFLVKFEPEHDSNQRISLIQQSMQQLRIAYSDLKAELAVVDRRRKKIRRRERENAANRSHQYK